MDMMGWFFGIMGFSQACFALQKVSKLEAELKRLGVIGAKFDSDPEWASASKPDPKRLALILAVGVAAAVILYFVRR